MPTMDKLPPEAEKAFNKYKEVYNQYTQDIRTHLYDKYGVDFDVLQIREDLGNLQFIGYARPVTQENIICTCALKMSGDIQDDYVYQRAMAEVRNKIIDGMENIGVPSVASVAVIDRNRNDQDHAMSFEDYIKANHAGTLLIAAALQTAPENDKRIKELFSDLLAEYKIKVILGLYYFAPEQFQALNESFRSGIRISFREMEEANPLYQSVFIING